MEKSYEEKEIDFIWKCLNAGQIPPFKRSKKYFTYDIWKKIVEINGRYISFVPEELRDYDICFLAISGYGDMLECVPEKFRDDKMCLCAAKRCSNGQDILNFVPKDCRTEEFYKEYVTQNGALIKNIPKDELTDEICEIAVNACYPVLKDIPEDKRTERVCRAALLSTDRGDTVACARDIPDAIWTDALYELVAQIYLEKYFIADTYMPKEILNRLEMQQALERIKGTQKKEQVGKDLEREKLQALIEEYGDLKKTVEKLNQEIEAKNKQIDLVMSEIGKIDPEFGQDKGVGKV